ncbi:hypothetical protein ZWY2020_018563 [Hordeum vulgare]|nr:hypothetical protein ZWY2020_018563 [Hordeum vulgare]
MSPSLASTTNGDDMWGGEEGMIGNEAEEGLEEEDSDAGGPCTRPPWTRPTSARPNHLRSITRPHRAAGGPPLVRRAHRAGGVGGVRSPINPLATSRYPSSIHPPAATPLAEQRGGSEEDEGDREDPGGGGEWPHRLLLRVLPPKTEEGVENLFERMDRMVAHGPNFCDITWGAGGSTADVTLDIANRMQNMVRMRGSDDAWRAPTCQWKIDNALDTIKNNGIQNVLALRGDPPHGQDKFVQVAGGFSCALDLVQHIRAKYGDYFGITVAGYPEAHPEVILGEDGATEEAYSKDLAYLKKGSLQSPCWFFRLKMKTIPAEITAALDPIKDNEEAVKAYGIHLGTEMCKKILASGIKTLHLYTLNMEKTALAILMNLGLIEESKLSRTLPWRPPTYVFRVKEDVRPIFWMGRSRRLCLQKASSNSSALEKLDQLIEKSKAFPSLTYIAVQKTYCLVSLVDNDYISGDLFAAFKEI